MTTPPPSDVVPSPPTDASPTIPRSRTSSFSDSLINARPHLGALAATGHIFGSAPSIKDLRRNSANGSIGMAGMGRRGSSLSAFTVAEKSPPILEDEHEAAPLSAQVAGAEDGDEDEKEKEKPGAWAVTVEGLRAFWGFFTKPFGFFITIYMLNVVAWGGMLFLLLCNASPAMCKPTCNDLYSPRRIWIEIDSQILNSLFCVTGFGLVPWRFRDLYYLLKWRCFGDQKGYAKLQEINESWFRAPEAVSIGPEAGAADEEAAADTETGKRAPPTASWKLDYVIWLYIWNTFFQCALSGFMWGMNRFDRPPWSTGLFVALACIVAGMAGGLVWQETRKVKRIEGEKTEDPDKRLGAKNKNKCGRSNVVAA